MDDNGRIEIWVNNKLSDSEQKEVITHELLHILNDDFSKKNVQEVEYRCHRETEEIMKTI